MVKLDGLTKQTKSICGQDGKLALALYRIWCPKQRSPLAEGFWRECAVSAGQRSKRRGAKDFQSTASFSECPTSEDSRCAAFCEVVHARGRGGHSQSVRMLCDCDDLVQAPAHSWTFVHQHRPGRYAGRSVQTHSGTPPSTECNLPSRGSSRRIVDVAASGPQAAAALGA